MEGTTCLELAQDIWGGTTYLELMQGTFVRGTAYLELVQGIFVGQHTWNECGIYFGHNILGLSAGLFFVQRTSATVWVAPATAVFMRTPPNLRSSRVYASPNYEYIPTFESIVSESRYFACNLVG